MKFALLDLTPMRPDGPLCDPMALRGERPSLTPLITGGGPMTFEMKDRRKPAVQCMSFVSPSVHQFQCLCHRPVARQTPRPHAHAGCRQCQNCGARCADQNGA